MPENKGFSKFRKKPVVISAKLMGVPFDVETLEGEMHGNAGDWLIVGVAGEKYPVKNEIFRKTYVPASREMGVMMVLNLLLIMFWSALFCVLSCFEPSFYLVYVWVTGRVLIFFQMTVVR
jgi:hypothetical protein